MTIEKCQKKSSTITDNNDGNVSLHYKIGDFVLTKISTISGSVKYFIGQIIKIEGVNIKIQFVRKKPNSHTFVYPPIEDISYIHMKSILKLLCQPTMNRREELVFELNDCNEYMIQ